MTNTTYQKIYLGGRIFMSLWFAISGFFELSRNPVVWDITLKLGYPEHFIYILGVFKICGSILFFVPNRLKEWIFAGMFFDITFAFFSKVAVLGLPSTVDTIVAFAVLFLTYYAFNKLYGAGYAAALSHK
ncbi:DoxX family protein [Sphingobacterium sp.]|uniref:DoxX family protein n=1 Tax=Sphingobacterium sp. TaxID=341027 RepID=UPI0028A99895|nr:DoxX family protein [Sphingobacterium sp.]